MFEIIFRDSAGNRPVRDYMEQLKEENSKDSRIKLTKIQEYIKVLRMYGRSVGRPYVDHLSGDIWELRPGRNRILFAGYIDGQYVLLHCFLKKTRKTPRSEIDKAFREYNDFLRGDYKHD